MISAIADVVAQGLKLADTIESNLNRPDIIAEATKRYRQKHKDAVDAAQAILANPKATPEQKHEAFQFIQRVES